MTDPYASLGRELTAAAERKEGHDGERGGVRAWLSRRVNAAAVATVLVLAGGAVAVAATGVLTGAPVRPEVQLSPTTGNGLPVPSGPHPLALRVPDPDGGLPWGLRVLHTTRGQICVQVGRVDDGQLGEIGVDSAFADDGRFHALSPDVLPPGYGGSSSDVQCTGPGQTTIVEDAQADRSAERLLPEEFREPTREHRDIPPARDLRALSYGLLGPHAVSVTYRTRTGTRTVPVSGPDGAFLIVEPAGFIAGTSNVGVTYGGEADASAVNVLLAPAHFSHAMVTGVTFRFGSQLCSQGPAAPTPRRCPRGRAIAPPRRWLSPTRSLHVPVHLTLLTQSRAACDAAFLRYPCYKGQVEFTAPYAVTAAGAEYEVDGIARCKVGGRPETSWGLERDVRRHEVIRTVSLGLFVFTPSCASSEAFQVRYLNQRGPSAQAPHESVILGTVSMRDATLPSGTPIAARSASPPAG